MTPFKSGDQVTHLKKPHRGKAIIESIKDGMATLKYPRYDLTVLARVRDLKKET